MRIELEVDAEPTADERAAVREVDGVSGRIALTYVPVARLLADLAGGASASARSRPYLISLAGTVGVGKSVTARILAGLLARTAGRPHVEIVPTDGFLLPRRELEERGIFHRKGFPESYDHAAAGRCLGDLLAGVPEVRVPVYSHQVNDIVPGAAQCLVEPDIVLVEGVYTSVLMRNGECPFDLTMYVHAPTDTVHSWYVQRSLGLIAQRIEDPAQPPWPLSPEESREMIERLWRDVNLVNAEENIVPSMELADLLMIKDDDHAVSSVRLTRDVF